MVPFYYNLRSLFVRRSSTLLTIFGIAATVAVIAGVLALQQGFQTLFTESGREDVAVYLRPGATNEGDSSFSRDRGLKLIKKRPEILQDANEQPIASMECYLAVRRRRMDGGEANIPIRGVQPMSFEVYGEFNIVEGRRFQPGTDEVVVGKRLVGRFRDCELGDIVQLNTVPFRVVGIFDTDSPFDSEIWGDLDRMLAALERFGPNRVVARVAPETDFEALTEIIESDKEVPAKVMSEREYFASQTQFISIALGVMAAVLGLIMGIAAVFTATNTMLAAISARTREIGILRASGFRPLPIFLSFQLEAILLGLLGGLVGCLIILPINGIETGTMNQTFTEVAFSFRVTPKVLGISVTFAILLGLIGGAIPAIRAARMKPTEAMRRV